MVIAQLTETFNNFVASLKERKRPRRPTTFTARPTLDALEDRVLLARTLLWVAGMGGNWSTQADWICSASTTPADVGNYFVPASTDSVVFDPSQSVKDAKTGNMVQGANTASTEDINTGGGVTVTNVTIASGYTSTIQVTGGSDFGVQGNFSMAAGTLQNKTGLGGDNRLFPFSSTGTFTWSGGTISLPTFLGGTNTHPTVSLQGDADKTLGADMKNYGTLTWTGNGNFMFTSGGAFENQSGMGWAATFNIQTDKQIGVVGTSSPKITNSGTFKKSAGTGTTTIVTDFDNSVSGVLLFGSGTVSFTGVVRQIDATATTQLNGGSVAFAKTFQLRSGTLTGVGTVAGSVDNSGGNVIPGLNGGSGTLNIGGPYTQEDNGTLTINIDASGNLGVLNVQGAATLAGTLTVNRNANYQPTSGDLQFLMYTSVTGDFAGSNGVGASNSWTVDGVPYYFEPFEGPTFYSLQTIQGD